MPKPAKKRVYKKKVYKRKPKMNKQISSAGLSVHKFARMSQSTYVVTSGVAGIPIVYQGNEVTMGPVVAAGAPFGGNNVSFGLGCIFKLSDVVNYIEFTNLFDSYRIKGVSATIAMMAANQVGNGQWQYIPDLYYINDYDDGTPPPNYGVIQEYENCKVRKLSAEKTVKLYFKPKPTGVVYTGNPVVPGYANTAPGQWLDCSSANVEHYGLKMFVENYQTNLNGMPPIRIQFKYYLEFRTVR